MVLAFDMVFSLLRDVVVPISKQRGCGFIPARGLDALNFSGSIRLQ
jgi:hypothetical protein